MTPSRRLKREVINMVTNELSNFAEHVVSSMPEHIEIRSVSAYAVLRAGLNHLEDRAKTYDNADGERSMAKTVAMFNTCFDKDITETQGWQFMEMLKMVRSAQGNFRLDNFEDGAAYSALAGESASKSSTGNVTPK